MNILQDFSFLDWTIITLVFISMAGSFVKGFAREVIILVSVVIGIVLASWSYPIIGDFFLRYVRTENIASILGFITVFIATLLVGTIVSYLMHRFVRLTHLQWFDRLLGAAFGLIRGWIIAAMLILLLTAFPVELVTVQKAKLAPSLLVSARILVSITPPSLKKRFLQGYSDLEKLWIESAKP